jgi:hypothetical protein
MSAVLEACREVTKKLSVIRVEQYEDGDRPGSLTMSMYFDMRIEVIRDYSGNCQTIQISKNREIQKK